jgi:hypothetical protein
MVPIDVARGLADGRHQELLAGPGAVQRFALRVAGRGLRSAAVTPRACGPLAI